MARTEARIHASVWRDASQADFRELGVGAQWLYWALLSQPELSMCGVLTTAPGRWARLAGGVSATDVRVWTSELSMGRFIVHDEDTAEVWIRTFVRSDGVLRSPNLTVAMARAFEEVHSAGIRAGIIGELEREFAGDVLLGIVRRFPKMFPGPEGLEEPLSEGLRKGLAEGFARRFPLGFLNAVTSTNEGLPEPLSEGLRDAVHGLCTHAGARPPITPITPSPHHLPSSSSETESPPSPPDPDDDDPTEAILDDLARHALVLRSQERPDRPVRDHDAWIATDRRRNDNRRRTLIAEHPNSTPQQLAELDMPTTGQATVPASESTIVARLTRTTTETE